MKTIGLVVNTEKPGARQMAALLARTARQKKIQIVHEKRTAQLLGVTGIPLSSLAKKVDGLVVAGGDGTLLSAVPAAAAADIPVLGINLGTLGFLTMVTHGQAVEAFTDFAAGRCTPQKRALLEVWLHAPEEKPKRLGVALNDAVFSRCHGLLLVDFEVSVDDRLVTRYSADGIIVATPTGSTAYSLSSHGALVSPDSPVWCLTPICPHSLTNRPLIVSDASTVRVRPHESNRLLLTLDGQREFTVREHQEVVIRRAPDSLTLALHGHYCFFSILRTKLRWSGSSAPSS